MDPVTDPIRLYINGEPCGWKMDTMGVNVAFGDPGPDGRLTISMLSSHL
jgi:hypothetical protein